MNLAACRTTRWWLLWVACFVALACGCERPTTVAECAPMVPRSADIVVAGSGVWTRFAEPRVGTAWLAESIGSGGAVAALLDGEIDIGLLSRPLKKREKDGQIVALAAGSSSVWIAGAGADAVRLYSAATTTSVDGHVARLWVREPGDSGWDVLRAAVPQLWAAMTRARAEGRAEVAWTDAEMAAVLRHVPGAVGPVDLAVWSGHDRVQRGGTSVVAKKPLFVIYRQGASAAVVSLAKRLAAEAHDAFP